MVISQPELEERARRAREELADCRLCPRQCRVNRLAGETGACGGGRAARVASCNLHHGEEPPVSGSRGSGTIFFSGCPMRCLFCQNYPISQLRQGNEAGPEELARMFLFLQARGCHNVNLVTGAHFAPQFLAGLARAVAGGFSLPVLYNTSGYESMETLALLEGVVDIYLPDLKYGSDKAGAAVSGVDDYFSRAAPAIREMYRQTGNLALDENGIAARGLMVRHLVLPGGLSTTPAVLRFLAGEISPDLHLSLMSQYFPAWRAAGHPVLKRRISRAEYRTMVNLAQALGLHNIFIQEIPGKNDRL